MSKKCFEWNKNCAREQKMCKGTKMWIWQKNVQSEQNMFRSIKMFKFHINRTEIYYRPNYDVSRFYLKKFQCHVYFYQEHTLEKQRLLSLLELAWILRLILLRRKKVSVLGLFWCREMKKRSNFKVKDLLNKSNKSIHVQNAFKSNTKKQQ